MSDNRIAEVTQADRDFFIVWNEARNEGFITDDEDDARACLEGGQRSGSTMGMEFAECYDDDERILERHRLTHSGESRNAAGEPYPGCYADLQRRRVTTLARLGLMLSVMAGGDAAEVVGFDAAELYAEVLMALAIEDAEDTDIALEGARDEPDSDILARHRTAASHDSDAGEREGLAKIICQNGPVVIDFMGEDIAWRPLDYGTWRPLATLTAPPTSDAGEEVETDAFLVEWVRDGETWVEAHADEVRAADQARKHGVKHIPLYRSPPTSGEETRLREESAGYREMVSKMQKRIRKLEGALMANPPIAPDHGSWWYPEGDTSSDACCTGPYEALESAADEMAEGETRVVVLERAMELPDVYAAVRIFTDAEKDERDDDEPWDFTLHATADEARAALKGGE